MANRKRNIQMKFYVTEDEKRLIDEKMSQLPTRRYGAYLRKMAIDGYIIYTDTADIKCAIFLAMGAGLVTGMGFIGYAVLFAAILGGAMFICSLTGFGGGRDEERALKITVPENLDYTEAFDEILADCTDSYRLINVKTTNMGSLFKLTYVVKLKKHTNQKDMIDKLRVRNGNLEIMLAQVDSGDMTL